MSGKTIEIAIKLKYVRLFVTDSLRAVYKHRDPFFMRHGNHLPKRQHAAGQVGYLRQRDHLCPFCEHRRKGLQIDLPVRSRSDAQFGLIAQAKLLPRYKIGMVLEHRNHDLVTLAYFPRHAARYQVDSVCRSLRKDDLF